jgi:hypothetical protein
LGSKDDRIVPRAKMPEEIALCKSNITEFLKDAKILIDRSALSHAYISIQYAVEEWSYIVTVNLITC